MQRWFILRRHSSSYRISKIIHKFLHENMCLFAFFSYDSITGVSTILQHKFKKSSYRTALTSWQVIKTNIYNAAFQKAKNAATPASFASYHHQKLSLSWQRTFLLTTGMSLPLWDARISQLTLRGPRGEFDPRIFRNFDGTGLETWSKGAACRRR